MKVLIYSDFHFSKSSSIQRGREARFSERIESLVSIKREISKIAKDHKVSMIIDAGDFLDQDHLDSEELEGLKEVLAVDKKTKEYHLNGNHGLVYSNFNSAAILDLLPNHHYVKELTYLNGGEIVLVPYGALIASLKEIKKEEPSLVITHEAILPSQQAKLYGSEDLLKELSKKDYKNTHFFNGHIHNYSQLTSNVVNIGSSSGVNFGDGHTLKSHDSFPGVIIYDTESLSWDRIILKNSNLFLKVSSKDQEALKSLKSSHRGRIYLEVSVSSAEESAIYANEEKVRIKKEYIEHRNKRIDRVDKAKKKGLVLDFILDNLNLDSEMREILEVEYGNKKIKD